jgi:hypothetical protein
MNVQELRDALENMVENGHGEAVVASVNGTGKVTPIMGWELAILGGYQPRRGAEQEPAKKALKFYTTSRF